MGISVSVGIGKWVKEPEELIISTKRQKRQYVTGIFWEKASFWIWKSLSRIRISLSRLFWTGWADVMKNGRQEDAENVLEEIKTAVRDSMVEKSRACMALQQIIRTVDRVCEDVSADMEQIMAGRDDLLHQVTEQKSFDRACGIVRNM